jgi:hypothetical protein
LGGKKGRNKKLTAFLPGSPALLAGSFTSDCSEARSGDFQGFFTTFFARTSPGGMN